MIAKTDTALRALSAQLKSRTMSRRYVAVVEGHLPVDEGRVDAAIGRHAVARKRMAVRYLGGRQAVTRYRVLARRERASYRYTVVEASLETGRTHQIRVHLAHLGHPVLGDATYGCRQAGAWSALGVARHLLHAYAIRFIHPVRQTPVELTAPLPDDMAEWARLDKPLTIC